MQPHPRVRDRRIGLRGPGCPARRSPSRRRVPAVEGRDVVPRGRLIRWCPDPLDGGHRALLPDRPREGEPLPDQVMIGTARASGSTQVLAGEVRLALDGQCRLGTAHDGLLGHHRSRARLPHRFHHRLRPRTHDLRPLRLRGVATIAAMTRSRTSGREVGVMLADEEAGSPNSSRNRRSPSCASTSGRRATRTSTVRS